MTMPGFTAETLLYRPQANFHATGLGSYSFEARAVMPQLPIATGCGTCTPLTWPDGTKTGACARACCDTLRCWTETCPCGTGSGVFRGGWGGVLSGGSVFAI